MHPLKEALKRNLTKKELECLRTGYDIIGSIAILEIPPELEKKEKLIAEEVQKLNPSVKTITKKTSAHGGVYRTRKIKIIKGKRTKKTQHKESKAVLELDVEKCYFSPRLSTERLRIAKQVKEGEEVLVGFSGIAPYPLVIAKNSKPNHIDAVEHNPIANEYAEKNATKNKSKEKISLYLDDFEN